MTTSTCCRFPSPFPLLPLQILVGNKCDDEENRKIPTSRGQALADEFGMKFFETSAKMGINVERAFLDVAQDVKRGMPGGQVDEVRREGRAESERGRKREAPPLSAITGPPACVDQDQSACIMRRWMTPPSGGSRCKSAIRRIARVSALPLVFFLHQSCLFDRASL